MYKSKIDESLDKSSFINSLGRENFKILARQFKKLLKHK